MAVLNDEVKMAIVRALACFDTPTQAATLVAQEFGIDITRMQAAKYDPSTTQGANLSAKWRTVFDATRAAFVEQVASIPIAQQSYRLRVLQRSLARLEQQGNVAMVLQLLEQAAKEVGGLYSNRREFTGRDGSPLVDLQPTKIWLLSPTRNEDGTWNFAARDQARAMADDADNTVDV